MNMILVCHQDISFSNDFDSSMQASFNMVFEVKDIEEGRQIAAFFKRDLRNGIKPLRIMQDNETLESWE